MSNSIDPYKVLGISPGASIEEIRRAYRHQATKYHSDAGGDAWVFQQIQSAYAHLCSNSSNITSSHRGDQTQGVDLDNAREQKSADHFGDSTGWTDNASATTNDRSSERVDSSGQETVLRHWLFGKPLRLHNETSYFVFANFMDLVMTGILLRYNAMEVNPVADLIYRSWGFGGLVAFKIFIVIFVCVIAQLIAARSMIKARSLLIGSTLLVAAVVVYSMWLARIHLGAS